MVGDLSMIESIGPTSGYMAVLVLALYINDQNQSMQRLYSNTWALWLICPVLLYWITRIWFAVKHSQLNEDPLIFAVRDRVSILVGVTVLVLALLASKFSSDGGPNETRNRRRPGVSLNSRQSDRVPQLHFFSFPKGHIDPAVGRRIIKVHSRGLG